MLVKRLNSVPAAMLPWEVSNRAVPAIHLHPGPPLMEATPNNLSRPAINSLDIHNLALSNQDMVWRRPCPHRRLDTACSKTLPRLVVTSRLTRAIQLMGLLERSVAASER